MVIYLSIPLLSFISFAFLSLTILSIASSLDDTCWRSASSLLTAGAGTRCMSLLRDSPTLCPSFAGWKRESQIVVTVALSTHDLPSATQRNMPFEESSRGGEEEELPSNRSLSLGSWKPLTYSRNSDQKQRLRDSGLLVECTSVGKSQTEEEQHQLLYLGFSIHQEVASDSFCFLINSSWLLVFILFLFHHALALNLYWWKGIHFS